MDSPACPTNTRFRQRDIYNMIQLLCQCRVCILEWHSRSHQRGTLTTRQKLAYKKSETAMTSGSFKKQMAGLGAALDKLTGCANTTQHYELYANLRRTLNLCQCAKDSNKTFQGVSKYIFVTGQHGSYQECLSTGLSRSSTAN